MSTETKIMVGSVAALGLGGYLKFSVRPVRIAYRVGRWRGRRLAR
jgi:hypothetical protein